MLWSTNTLVTKIFSRDTNMLLQRTLRKQFVQKTCGCSIAHGLTGKGDQRFFKTGDQSESNKRGIV